MRPRSLLGITLELIREVTAPGPYPADARVGRFFRERRYLGSRDRRFIGDATYSWLRLHHRARARWQSWTPAGSDVPARSVPVEQQDDVHLLDLLAVAQEGSFPWSFRELEQVVVELLEDGKREWHQLVRQATHGGFPGDDAWPEDGDERFAARTSLPVWIASRLRSLHGDEDALKIAEAFNRPAPVDLRVNLRRTTREKARKSLCRDLDLEIEPTHFSPLGLRVPQRRNLSSTTASRKCWIEVQDEGSQLAILSADTSAGMTVVDACAGNGGKTLALADLLFCAEENTDFVEGARKSRVLACDIEIARLRELRRRARDARLSDRLEYVRVGERGSIDGLLPKSHLVLVDAPCTGLGTLRRNPELKLRYTDEDVRNFHDLQLSILERFAPLVRKRGRLVYVTCSFLEEECESVADAFEAAHPDFERSPSFWASTRLPATAMRENRIRLDPVTTQTDAFFIASWRRIDTPPTAESPPPGNEALAQTLDGDDLS